MALPTKATPVTLKIPGLEYARIVVTKWTVEHGPVIDITILNQQFFGRFTGGWLEDSEALHTALEDYDLQRRIEAVPHLAALARTGQNERAGRVYFRPNVTTPGATRVNRWHTTHEQATAFGAPYVELHTHNEIPGRLPYWLLGRNGAQDVYEEQHDHDTPDLNERIREHMSVNAEAWLVEQALHGNHALPALQARWDADPKRNAC